ncbi:thiolase family protein [Lujinxingia vulgaris]|uniref:acetyl-CoA C-acyltransferase n=1 Tax=Lujinxingia vulgaris TaxID=2600176 RepID=A0A5C6XB82_9DELT|nr:thiolase family protein [Lujinxingia vulgaris]TXD34598.1 thiolase family protein [Lujinxingia vulgaris]
MTSLRDVVVASYVRTPFTRAYKGGLKDTRPDTMAALVIKEAVAKVKGLNPEDIGDVAIGCAMPEAEQGMNVARVASVMAGLPNTVPGLTVNRFCSSGVQTISQMAERIMIGAMDVAVAGGTESMTMIPMGGNKVSANPQTMAEYPEIYIPMGTTAENVAKRFEVAREDQDAFALTSHEKALAAWEDGFLAGEVLPVKTQVVGPDGKRHDVTVDKDDGPRPGSSVEALAKLRPAFNPKGSVTAGNASPLTDGAAAVVLMSKEKADELGVKPMGYYRAFQVAGVDPEIMGIGPVPAIRKLLKATGLSIEDIDLFEINEAFASQAVYCARELGVDPAKLNIHGGAIALGHPLGVSGTRMAGTLLRSLEKTGGRYGIVSMCIGGGMGAAALFERVED